MPDAIQTLHVQITTAQGDVFSDWVDGAEIKTAGGAIRLVPNKHAYMSFSGASRLCLRQGVAYVSFNLHNSVAHVAPQHLRIVAEDAERNHTDDNESAAEAAVTLGSSQAKKRAP